MDADVPVLTSVEYKENHQRIIIGNKPAFDASNSGRIVPIHICF